MNLNRIVVVIPFFLIVISCNSEYRKNREFILPEGNYYISSLNLQEFPNRYLVSKDSVSITIAKKDLIKADIIWVVKHLNGNYFKIMSVHSEKFLTAVKDENKEEKYQLSLLKETNDDAQTWIIHRYKNNRFKINNKSNFQCLFVSVNSFTYPGLRICNNKLHEYWAFEKTD